MTTTNDLLSALARSRYSAPGWVLLPEITFTDPGTRPGERQERRADAYAVSVWRSAGLGRIEGFEFKVWRSDWLQEMKRPEKSRIHRSIVDAWWLVAPAGVAKLEELPEEWGFLELRGRGLYLLKKAPRLPRDPNTVPRSVMARLLHRSIGSAECAARNAADERYRWLLRRKVEWMGEE